MKQVDRDFLRQVEECFRAWKIEYPVESDVVGAERFIHWLTRQVIVKGNPVPLDVIKVDRITRLPRPQRFR